MSEVFYVKSGVGEKRSFAISFANDLDSGETLSNPEIKAPSDLTISNEQVTSSQRTIAGVDTPAEQGVTFTVDFSQASVGHKEIDVFADTSAGQKVGWRISVLVE